MPIRTWLIRVYIVAAGICFVYGVLKYKVFYYLEVYFTEICYLPAEV
jgi:hypothetical protein